jgi:hypothetical protein
MYSISLVGSKRPRVTRGTLKLTCGLPCGFSDDANLHELPADLSLSISRDITQVVHDRPILHINKVSTGIRVARAAAVAVLVATSASTVLPTAETRISLFAKDIFLSPLLLKKAILNDFWPL